ncbi:hypothetical protein Ndes2437B_g00080 [Nannochloris sp. 'desiccata']
MRFSLIFLAIMAVLFMSQGSFARNPKDKVCKLAKNPPIPGGWTKLTGKEVRANSALKADAETTAASLMKGRYTGCTAEKVVVTKACSQVVAGTNYEYAAKAKAKCGKKTMPFSFSHTFFAPL